MGGSVKKCKWCQCIFSFWWFSFKTANPPNFNTCISDYAVCTVDLNFYTTTTTSYLNPFFKVVELLLEKGANYEHRNVSDYTPLSLAASGGYVNVIKLLLKYKADINSR